MRQPLNPDQLELVRATKGFMPDDEGAALHEAALAAAASGLGPLLEVGTYCGKSALYLGFAAREQGGIVLSVDHHRGSEENQAGWEHHDVALVDPRNGRMDTLPLARRAVELAGLEGTVVLVVGHSTVVAAAWTTPLSLLFIDGGHGADVAWADFRAWTPKVANGGLLAIHDVFPDPADGGRPPYEIFCAALDSGAFKEEPDMGCGSLRVLRCVGAA
ncbi:MAG TPA: class I SAM-dependent methyltransferase [Acidimicrobiales bacterium]|nr:class I SAM-dependent methyltransferase [Acidimicrobiales bacterium]